MRETRHRRILCQSRMLLLCGSVQRFRITGRSCDPSQSEDSPYYQETKKQALNALKTYPEGLQIGGGVCPENAEDYLDAAQAM